MDKYVLVRIYVYIVSMCLQGKPVMFRSVLKTKKKKKKHNREEEAKRAQQLRYFET